jgi:ribosomal protein L28
LSKTARTYITHITDPMILVYPKFETPDVYVKDGVAGKPAYKTDAKAVDEAGMIKAQAFVLAELVKLFPDMDPKTRRRTLANGDTKTVFWPFKTHKDTGEVTLTAKTARTNKKGELMRVPMFGANNKQLPDSIYPGGGTVARLDLTLNAMPNDGGINFYINAVQVLKLEESSFGKSNFEPTDGYVYEAPEEPEEPKSNFGASTADEADAAKF